MHALVIFYLGDHKLDGVGWNANSLSDEDWDSGSQTKENWDECDLVNNPYGKILLLYIVYTLYVTCTIIIYMQ